MPASRAPRSPAFCSPAHHSAPPCTGPAWHAGPTRQAGSGEQRAEALDPRRPTRHVGPTAGAKPRLHARRRLGGPNPRRHDGAPPPRAARRPAATLPKRARHPRPRSCLATNAPRSRTLAGEPSARAQAAPLAPAHGHAPSAPAGKPAAQGTWARARGSSKGTSPATDRRPSLALERGPGWARLLASSGDAGRVAAALGRTQGAGWAEAAPALSRLLRASAHRCHRASGSPCSAPPSYRARPRAPSRAPQPLFQLPRPPTGLARMEEMAPQGRDQCRAAGGERRWGGAWWRRPPVHGTKSTTRQHRHHDESSPPPPPPGRPEDTAKPAAATPAYLTRRHPCRPRGLAARSPCLSGPFPQAPHLLRARGAPLAHPGLLLTPPTARLTAVPSSWGHLALCPDPRGGPPTGTDASIPHRLPPPHAHAQHPGRARGGASRAHGAHPYAHRGRLGTGGENGSVKVQRGARGSFLPLIGSALPSASAGTGPWTDTQLRWLTAARPSWRQGAGERRAAISFGEQPQEKMDAGLERGMAWVDAEAGRGTPSKVPARSAKGRPAALAGNRTRVNCLEGSYAHHYTTNAAQPGLPRDAGPGLAPSRPPPPPPPSAAAAPAARARARPPRRSARRRTDRQGGAAGATLGAPPFADRPAKPGAPALQSPVRGSPQPSPQAARPEAALRQQREDRERTHPPPVPAAVQLCSARARRASRRVAGSPVRQPLGAGRSSGAAGSRGSLGSAVPNDRRPTARGPRGGVPVGRPGTGGDTHHYTNEDGGGRPGARPLSGCLPTPTPALEALPATGARHVCPIRPDSQTTASSSKAARGPHTTPTARPALAAAATAAGNAESAPPLASLPCGDRAARKRPSREGQRGGEEKGGARRAAALSRPAPGVGDGGGGGGGAGRVRWPCSPSAGARVPSVGAPTKTPARRRGRPRAPPAASAPSQASGHAPRPAVRMAERSKALRSGRPSHLGGLWCPPRLFTRGLAGAHTRSPAFCSPAHHSALLARGLPGTRPQPGKLAPGSSEPKPWIPVAHMPLGRANAGQAHAQAPRGPKPHDDGAPPPRAALRPCNHSAKARPPSKTALLPLHQGTPEPNPCGRAIGQKRRGQAQAPRVSWPERRSAAGRPRRRSPACGSHGRPHATALAHPALPCPVPCTALPRPAGPRCSRPRTATRPAHQRGSPPQGTWARARGSSKGTSPATDRRPSLALECVPGWARLLASSSDAGRVAAAWSREKARDGPDSPALSRCLSALGPQRLSPVRAPS
nr:collagen alpha-1(I) chain-like [Equus asinus]